VLKKDLTRPEHQTQLAGGGGDCWKRLGSGNGIDDCVDGKAVFCGWTRRKLDTVQGTGNRDSRSPHLLCKVKSHLSRVRISRMSAQA